MKDHLTEILLALSDAGVDYIVAGGVAAVLHGVERVTSDLDIAIHFSRDNVAAFEKAMNTLGMRPKVPISIMDLADPDIRAMIVSQKHAVVMSFIDLNDPLKYVDVFMRDELSYERLTEDSVSISVDGRVIRVISIDSLIRVKRQINPPRDKDSYDIQQLERLRE